MKKSFCIALFYFLLFNSISYSQQKNIVSDYAFAEKIYVQLSSTVVTTGTPIWFKAVVTDVAQIPTRLSSVLHVELIDFDKRIIAKKLLKLENGIADGFFDLDEHLPIGRYQLRAYTHWNKNFGKDFISKTYIDIYAPKKIIESEEAIQNVLLSETASGQFLISATAYPKILNPKYRGRLKMYVHTENKIDSVQVKKGEDDVYSFEYLLPKDAVKAKVEMKLDSITLKSHGKVFVSSYSKTVAVNKGFVDLQFFPEGGKLVSGITSKVGFKALDYKNEGLVVSGFVVDDDGVIVMPYKSNDLGMGVTYITPVQGKKYYAKLEGENGIVRKYKLPEVSATGAVLSVKEQQQNIILSIKSKGVNDSDLLVHISSGGVEQDQFSLVLNNGAAITGLEKAMFSEGLLKFSVSNKAGQILCERLFFNFKEEDRISISSTLNLKKYNQRGKTKINLITKNNEGAGIKTNLSVLVVNKNQLGTVHENGSNIMSYFLLNSELKGRIEKPTSYFDTTNKRRKHDMDALLLTQGWSNYKYVNTETKSDFKFLPEKGLTVSGKVSNLIMSKRELSKPVDLTIIYGPLNVMTQRVEKTGNFYFQLEDYYKDLFKVMIQTKTKNDKKKNYLIDLDRYNSPKVNYDTKLHISLPDETNEFLKQSIVKSKKVEAFEKKGGVIDLDEVQISGYKMTPERETMKNRHGMPDVVIEEEELLDAKENWHTGLYSLLESNYPNDIEIYRVSPPPAVIFKNELLLEVGIQENSLVARDYKTDFTFVVIDGIPVEFRDYSFLDLIPIEAIKSVELIKKPKSARLYQLRVFGNTLYDAPGEDGVNGDMRFAGLPGEARISIISIFTHAGKGYNGIQKPKGMFKGVVPGFATKREFYAPKYDAGSYNDWTMPDLRSVVYWAPNIETDTEGNAEVEFYNGDDIGEMLIITEGITETGKLGSSKAAYTVDRRIE